ncbi:hypothetical protein BOTBODRAFT_180408 [Botryobasidium botryosum FD-172 SS1]|uniref:Uncharacterized protein n=1 Tax=Botryobasidium botryosum (strain FD-172 SS1) TaxID=930990 RepID=A0A067LZB9_BOTB1|nr:hypothetical protein BOTBODRAFT_180408 [Botryobasidium botryosum FD-172 SS1]
MPSTHDGRLLHRRCHVTTAIFDIATINHHRPPCLADSTLVAPSSDLPGSQIPSPTSSLAHPSTHLTTYVALDGHPFFCPIHCDSCTCPGFRYIVDKNCPCARCTTFATTPIATPTDIIAQRCRRLGPIDNLSYNDLQHLSEGDLFERLYPTHHASQENLPELATLARINYEDALPTDPDNAASWLAFRDMDTSIIAPPSWRDIKTDIENTLSVHSEGALPNIIALTVVASAYMIAEYHPRSEDIPEATVDSILEIFHYSITRSCILDELIDNPDFMSLLAARAPQLLPAPNTPPRPRSRTGQTGPPPSPLALAWPSPPLHTPWRPPPLSASPNHPPRRSLPSSQGRPTATAPTQTRPPSSLLTGFPSANRAPPLSSATTPSARPLDTRPASSLLPGPKPVTSSSPMVLRMHFYLE